MIVEPFRKYGSDRIVILGSGGARFMATTQYRSTGGFVLQVLHGKVQAHVDPGPGAIRDLKDHKDVADAKNTNYVILTHEHNDHDMSIPVIVEALQNDMEFKVKKGTFVCPSGYLNSEKYYFRMLEQLVGMNAGEVVELEPGFSIEAKSAWHSDAVPNVGYVMKFGDTESDYHYSIAFTSDTEPFPDYISNYRDVDVLVANLLRPDDIVCRGHMCTDQLIPLLQEIKPAICILVHFGRRMDNDIEGNQVPQQVQKIQDAMVDCNTIIIGPSDGQVIEFAKVLGGN